MSWLESYLKRIGFTGKVLIMGYNREKQMIHAQANCHNGTPGNMQKLEVSEIQEIKPA